MIKTAAPTPRRVSTLMPSELMIEVRKSVKTEKLSMNPAMIPYGRLRPPTAPESMIGSIGKMQGESVTATPAKKLVISKIIVCGLIVVYCFHELF